MENKELCIHGNDFKLSSTTCKSSTSCLFDVLPYMLKKVGIKETKRLFGEEVVGEFFKKYGEKITLNGVDNYCINVNQ